MHSYLIVQSSHHKPGTAIDAILCEYPNRGSDAPVDDLDRLGL
jgi:hypothetical protein